jgi:uncharacterized protein YqgV (UPF0045/DUF77 family)
MRLEFGHNEKMGLQTVKALRGEVTIEPWHEDEPGPHVIVALEVLKRMGSEPALEALSITIEGPADRMVAAFEEATIASIDAGATRVSVSFTVQPPLTHPVVKTAQELAEAVGGRLIPVADMTPNDIVIEHKGEVLAGLRKPRINLDGALERLVTDVETQFGAPLKELDRGDKQAALVVLQSRGAFTIRNAADELADMLGISRVTLYNYLSAVQQAETDPQNTGPR